MSKDDEYIAEMEAEIEQLTAADYATWAKAAEEENTRLRELNAEMLGVLREIRAGTSQYWHFGFSFQRRLNAAIAKAGGPT